MATRPKKISVSVTAGRNAPVNHVLRLEDLLLQLQPAPAKARRTHASITRPASPLPVRPSRTTFVSMTARSMTSL